MDAFANLGNDQGSETFVILFIFYALGYKERYNSGILPSWPGIVEMCLVYFMEAVTGCGGGGCCCLKLRLENQLWKRVFRFQYQRGLGRSLGMSCREKKTDIPTGHLKWLLPPLKSV